MDPVLILSLFMIAGAAFLHTRLLRRTLRDQRARLEEARLALGKARRAADEAELARRNVSETLERRAAELAEAEKAVDALEQRFAELKLKPPRRYFVIDRQSPRGLPIWEVPVRARDGAHVPEITRPSWSAGRTYLVTAQTSHEAGFRCISRFPAKSGFEVGQASPFQAGGNAGAARGPRVVGRQGATEPDPAPDPAPDEAPTAESQEAAAAPPPATVAAEGAA
ncbi:hypothetical protein [Arenibaculum pallidiluteum]|uniref:hypothetical protein n=1 Tax=Arenibaculum pallidiluteum TaxID=2812559 RepID=UPI001A95CA97|nr:hypothetical protein [Arenibaculum pallidiluteum]